MQNDISYKRPNFKQLIFPQDCVLCNGTSQVGVVCQECLITLPVHKQPACPQCGLWSPQSEQCGSCLKALPEFDKTTAAFDYEFPIVELIRAYKYGSRLALGDFFAEHLMNKIKHEARPEILLPMPLHTFRLKQRGFNQAAEITRYISSQMNLQMSLTSLIKTRDTLPQVELPWDERRKNIKNAFECKDTFSNMHVAIIDDVITTGASLNEAAKVLKKHGAKTVSVWVIARTQLKN